MAWSKKTWVSLGVGTAVLLAVLLFYRAVWGDVPTLVAALDHCDELFCDFTRQYYPTGQALFETGQPSNGYFYTTAFALLMAVFARFELGTAVLLWGIFQLAALGLLFAAGYDLLERTHPARWLYWPLLLLSMPVMHNLKWGQVSIFVTGCILGTLALYRRGHGKAAMGLLVLGTAVKYYAALFLIYFLIKREWRLLLLFGLFSVLLIGVLPLALLGFDTNWQFYQFMSERIAHARSTWMLTDINSQNLGHLLARLRDPQPISQPLWQGIGYALAGGGLALAWLRLRRSGDACAPLFWTILLLSLPLFVETSWPHYFVYLPFAQVLLLQTVWSDKWPRPAKIVGLMLVAISILLSTMPFFMLWDDWRPFERWGMLFWANAALLLCWYLSQSSIVNRQS
ncbi:MAG: DUF2029 domain-containing protein [Anaerolineales bacterium]|nr:DUF2029 domain-containing protein [Anaerolineales bacterium]